MGNHARLAPSSASRWRACPGSIRMSEDVVSADTAYSLAGTAAHEAFYLWLTGGSPPAIGTLTSAGLPVTEEMIDSLRPMVAWVVNYQKATEGRLFAEEKIEIGGHLGLDDEECWGTADVMVLSENELCIADLKTGYVSVDPDCEQLNLYALGAWHETGCLYDTVRLVILQPQDETPVKEVVLTRADLLQRSEQYGTYLLLASVSDAPLVPGDEQCRFCPAAGACPALQEETLRLAEFEAVGNPLALSLDQMSIILKKADMIETALKAIRGHVVKLLSTGQVVPGWKLVESKKRRIWKSEATILDDLLLDAPKVSLDKLAPRKVVSPAQAEKLISKDIVAKYTEIPAGDPTLAPEEDRRPTFTLDFPAVKELTQ